MITLDVFTPAQTRSAPSPLHTDGLNRLFAAAVVSPAFCQMLLSEPEQALANGFLGQAFPLSEEEKVLVTTLRAQSLPDLARQIRRALRGGH
ncbi:MAG: hypothetical protein HY869_21070 [Chloroflexi bacterium]|nr:hypothetical protein [Chloroflexota bacterium]